MIEKRLKIAVIQMASGDSKESNIRKSLSMLDIATARKADLAIFPEYQMISMPYEKRADILEASEETEGNYTRRFMEYARKNSVNVLCNFAERVSGSAKPYNASVLINRSGYGTGKYRKIHLFDALGKNESYAYNAGLEPPEPFSLPELKLGVQICFDLRFPEGARLLAIKGAEMLIYQAGWFKGDHKLEQWRTLLKARAIENGTFVVGSAQCGESFTGHSVIISPYGEILDEAGDRETVIIADIDLAEVEKYREEVPVIRSRRLDIYDIRGY
ncbi:MAG: carbon-nitrogen hydrolase family protein [Candidatus Thermoplasmatota archaeon]|nr:carbon-nitrogen hydrolase family protein [Candidatus Thermoplasmatota archaeon]